MNDQIKVLIDEALEEERKTNGKRFSTHTEAQANIRMLFENGMEATKEVARCVDFLWYSARTEDFGEDYTRAIEDTKRNLLRVIYEDLAAYVMLEKLGGGVVHEPKS